LGIDTSVTSRVIDLLDDARANRTNAQVDASQVKELAEREDDPRLRRFIN
jgi:hypothetical protein